MMSIKSNIMKIGVCSVMVLVPLSQTSLPSFAAEEIALKESQDVVNIPDPQLKKELNLYLNQAENADITEAQMATFRNITLNSGIKDLTGIEYLKNITTLSINNINASYEPIQTLSSLEKLVINGENVNADIIPDLSVLSNLTFLDLSRTNIDDTIFSKISNIPNLNKLDISNNKGITKISELNNLPSLQELRVSNCQITNFKGIEKFPNLTAFYGDGQLFGIDSFETDGFKNIKSSELTFDANAKTLFVPFSIVTVNTILNYDGLSLPYNTNPDYTSIALGDQSYVVTNDKISINQQGITLSDFTQADFDELEAFEVYLGFDSGNISKPANLANGTYSLKQIGSYRAFSVDHSVNITAQDNISYIQNDTVTPEKFLTDIKADANGGTITSDLTDKVDFTKPGNYTVTLNAQNTKGLKGEPIQVTVTIIEKTVITADPEVTYDLNEAITEEEFLAEIKATTNDDTMITSDFESAVDFTKAGEYIVTLNAENDTQKAAPLTVKIRVNPKLPDPVVPIPYPDP
ncbi:lmo1289 family class 1 internalin, partial [Listeria monocytogenes]|nr:lmo1289 family class 1 internalin [Listeria monocytogenes]EAD6684436.1 lmo1289 family class 1 internalin [Listeria monocytogenes]EGC1506636.1 lmo1289 family class 1 internalin [Listeria monocytogenes]HAB6450685.1 lmo1289 family class 1 internalin [Listeria monocytogenes]